MRKIKFLFFVLLFTGCTHTLTHAPLASIEPPSEASSKTVEVIIDGESANRIETRDQGIDSWKFDVGPALVDILPQVLGAHFPNSMVRRSDQDSTKQVEIVVNLSLKEFGVNFVPMPLGSNDCKVVLSGSLNAPGKADAITFEATGRGEEGDHNYAASYAVLLVGRLWQQGTAQALETMLSKCVADASEKVAEEILKVK